MQLSIIIVNYNVKYFLEQCLYSVVKACQHIDAEILVIDNCSTDDSQAYFINKFSTVKFIWHSQNVGFAKANNIALKQATGEYILFLNPDTIVPEDCFEKVIAFANMANNFGALGIRMLDGAGHFLKESKRAFPSPLTSFFKVMGLSNLFPHSKIFAKYHLGFLSQMNNHVVDVLAGAFMLVPKKILDSVGSFDEAFFMYAEDVDLSYRIQKAGYTNYYFAESAIIHFKGESTKKESLKYVKMFYGAMSMFVKKHYSRDTARFYRVLIQAAIWSKAIVSAFKNFVTQLFDSKKLIRNNSPALVIGNQASFYEVVDLLNKTNTIQKIIGRISITKEDDCLGTLIELPQLIAKYNAQEIIFCPNGLLYADVILLMQQLPNTISFRFHAASSKSIIGSISKDFSADYIVAND